MTDAQADYTQRINSAPAPALPEAKPVASPAEGEADDEMYEIGKRDGYEDAIQDLDLATGGDGEFKGSTFPGETVDVPAMKARIIERFEKDPLFWPDFVAPPKYDNPADGWTDPRLPDFRLIWQVAKEAGYAVGLHGSMKRDCDLIAVPWVEACAPPDALIERLCTALNAKEVGAREPKPNGRIAVNLQIDGWVKLIDLSIVASPDREAATREAVTDEMVLAVAKVLAGFNTFYPDRAALKARLIRALAQQAKPQQEKI